MHSPRRKSFEKYQVEGMLGIQPPIAHPRHIYDYSRPPTYRYTSGSETYASDAHDAEMELKYPCNITERAPYYIMEPNYPSDSYSTVRYAPTPIHYNDMHPHYEAPRYHSHRSRNVDYNEVYIEKRRKNHSRMRRKPDNIIQQYKWSKNPEVASVIEVLNVMHVDVRRVPPMPLNPPYTAM